MPSCRAWWIFICKNTSFIKIILDSYVYIIYNGLINNEQGYILMSHRLNQPLLKTLEMAYEHIQTFDLSEIGYIEPVLKEGLVYITKRSDTPELSQKKQKELDNEVRALLGCFAQMRQDADNGFMAMYGAASIHLSNIIEIPSW